MINRVTMVKQWNAGHMTLSHQKFLAKGSHDTISKTSRPEHLNGSYYYNKRLGDRNISNMRTTVLSYVHHL